MKGSMATATTTETKRFYSRVSNLSIHWKHGELKQLGDRMARIGEEHIRFTPFSKGVKIGKEVVFFGQRSTSNPEEIAYLEQRCLNEKDVVTEYEFNRLLVPPEAQIDEAQREITRLRGQVGSLEQVLAAQGKKPRGE